MLLQILGTRQPILFTEGDEGSHDVALFRLLYPDHLVLPRSGCEQVILATRAIREAQDRLHVDARGIIDRDRRHLAEIAGLRNSGVEVLGVAEVENLFCVPEVLRIVAEQLGFSSDEKLVEAENFVFNKLRRDLERQVSLHVAQEIKFRLNFFDIKKQGPVELQNELQSLTNSIDVNALYQAKRAEFTDVLTRRDYLGALSIFNNKGIVMEMSRLFGGTQIPKLVIRLANGGKQKEVRQALSAYVPQF